MRQFLTYGSVRGVPGDRHSYRDWPKALRRFGFPDVFLTSPMQHLGKERVWPLKLNINNSSASCDGHDGFSDAIKSRRGDIIADATASRRFTNPEGTTGLINPKTRLLRICSI